MKTTSCLTIAGVVTSLAALAACGGGSLPPVKQPPPHFNYFQIVDGIDNPDTIQYAYAPSIILQNSVYHILFCSGGNIFPAWDYIRYVSSSDNGRTWSTPADMLHATAFNGMDLAACDPSVIFFQGFYYMYYGAAITTAPNVFQTVIQVARATATTGPYLTYTQRGTWEDTPTDPLVMLKPMKTRFQQPSVVRHADGRL
jgi:beta-xylosidase